MYQVLREVPAEQGIIVPDWIEPVIDSAALSLGRLTSTTVSSITIRGILRDRKRRSQLLNIVEALAGRYDLEALVDFDDDNDFTLRFTTARL